MARALTETKIKQRVGRSRLGAFACLIAMIISPVALAAAPQPSDQVPLSSYSGQWFQIAGTPNQLQRGCASTSVVYTVENPRRVRAEYRCERDGRDTRVTRLNGRILDPGNNAKLRLTYMGFLSQEYWILFQDPAGWGIVGDPSGKYVWIMSRSDTLPDAERTRAFAKLREFGYDLSRVKS